MNSISLSGAFATAIFGISLAAFPVQAIPIESIEQPSEINFPSIDAILNVEPDFFDEGHEMFEEEIERLMRRQQDSESPILTIDESVWFDSESLEMLEAPSSSPGEASESP